MLLGNKWLKIKSKRGYDSSIWGNVFRTQETEPYNRLMKFYILEPLLEGCFMILNPIFKIGSCLESLCS
jgi:hypothetical protein